MSSEMKDKEQSAVSDQLSAYSEEMELAELAMKLMNKYSKPSMALALALLLERGSMFRICDIVQNTLDISPNLSKDEIENLCKLKAEG
ncbi:hypothetical protein [Thiohalophilus sp.]|uniref:hypothetical protein n=1 Tax=Thiohalophilus sp. TaxID=3028392 RepID=UPI002ACDE0B5|nr:hypothetical protein [Thiohalophilus sp.]MDZ7802384.1 hypothetical protein [Thiohalophilus sp.]